MKISIYFKDRSELSQIKEPYRGALEILEGLYFDVPGNGARLSTNRMPDYKVMNTVQVICDILKAESVAFASSLLACYKASYLNTSSISKDAGDFWTINLTDCAVLFGAVYYALAQDLAISDTNLNFITKLFTDEPARLYFQTFKEPADKLRKELKEGQTIIDVTGNKDMAKLVTRQREQIKTLEAKVQELQKSQPNVTSEENTLDGSNSPSCEEMTIELLTHIFYNNEDNVKEFLEKIKGFSDVEIIDVVHTWVKDKKISSKSYKRDLWRVLHAARLYTATESNWNTVLRNHPE